MTYHQLVVPGLRYLAGETLTPQHLLSATAGHPLKKQPGRTDFQRGIFSTDKGVITVISAGVQNSGVLSAMANANCYIRLDAERGPVAAGELVSIIPFDEFIH